MVGRDPASIVHSLGLDSVLAQGHHLSGRLFAQVSLSQSHGATTGGGRRRSSGIVAAAGVVNQADEQCILLPGYFTTPGLHHTHPLQADLVGPGRPGTRGVGVGVCKRVFPLAQGISATLLLRGSWGLSKHNRCCPLSPCPPRAAAESALLRGSRPRLRSPAVSDEPQGSSRGVLPADHRRHGPPGPVLPASLCAPTTAAPQQPSANRQDRAPGTDSRLLPQRSGPSLHVPQLSRDTPVSPLQSSLSPPSPRRLPDAIVCWFCRPCLQKLSGTPTLLTMLSPTAAARA